MPKAPSAGAAKAPRAVMEAGYLRRRMAKALRALDIWICKYIYIYIYMYIYTWNPDNPIIFGRWVFYGFLRAFRGNYGRLGNLWAFCFWLLKLRIIMGV